MFALGPDERMTVVDTRGSQSGRGVRARDGRARRRGGARTRAPTRRDRDPRGAGRPRRQLAGARARRDADSIRPKRWRSGCSATRRRAGFAQTFRAERAVTVVVAAPAGRIVDGAPPPSELLVEVRRATPRGCEQQELPPPLAEPRLDFRVEAATALAYELAPGEVVQVINVEGSSAPTSSRSIGQARVGLGPGSTRRRPLAHGAGVPAARTPGKF